MNEIISAYQRLLSRIEDENEHIEKCIQGDILERYRELLNSEKERIKKMLRTI